KAANRQADVQESRADLTTLQGVIERLKEELSRMLEAFQEIMERIFAMLQAKGETLHNLSSRPAAI
ncbi:type III secretion system translocon subunit SctE, partial [Pseudomonas aeruginosa]